MTIKYLRDIFLALCFLVAVVASLVNVDLNELKDSPKPRQESKITPKINQMIFTGVARVVDGDTVVMESERLRLIGMDAPELAQTCLDGERVVQCGKASKAHLEMLVTGKSLACRAAKRDRYGRPLVTCAVGGRDINREMVLAGHAVDFGKYQGEAQQAEAAERGLWGSTFVRPADWRKTHKTATRQ